MFRLCVSAIILLWVKTLATIPPITLNNGQKMPSIGLGTFPMKNNPDTLHILNEAINVGYRKFDTAFNYGNEKVVGQAVREAVASGKYKREDFFVQTKIWNTYHSRQLVHKQMEMSLKNLGLDYVDLLLMHYPTGYAYQGDSAPIPDNSDAKEFHPKYPNGTIIPSSWNKDDYIDTYHGMEDMVDKKWAKSIGVSNFNTHQLNALLEKCKIKPVMNQFECNPFYAQKRLVKHCHSVGVLPEAYKALDPTLESEPIIQEITKKYSKTASQVSIRWLLERGVTSIAKTTRRERMEENIKVFDFNLTETEVNKIFEVKAKPKRIDNKEAQTHPDYSFNELME